MKKLSVFPITEDTVPICRFNKLLQGYKLIGAIVPKGRNFENSGYGIIDGSYEDGITLTEQYSKTLENTDSILFTEEIETVHDWRTYIEEAKRLNKEIIVTNNLVKSLKKKGIEIKYDRIVGKNSSISNINLDLADSYLYRLDIPIIMVYGLGEQCNKFDLQLAIRKHFIDKGYSILQFGTKEYSELFGFEKLPEEVFDESKSLEERILYLNHYIYYKSENALSDVIIIGVPGGIMPYNNFFHNHFSEIPYIISNAFTADISILSAYLFKGINYDYFKDIRDYARSKFGCIIDYIHLSNVSYSVNKDDSVPYLYFLASKRERVNDILEKRFKENHDYFKVFNIFNSSLTYALETMENELQDNVDVI